MARTKTDPKKKIIAVLIVGIIASVIGALLYDTLFGSDSSVYRVRIVPIGEGHLVRIAADELEGEPNADGILFVHPTITTEEDSAQVIVEVQPRDESVWYKQSVQSAGQKTHVGRVQLGSKEWPIRGGEEYLLRASMGTGQATARITVEEVRAETR